MSDFRGNLRGSSFQTEVTFEIQGLFPFHSCFGSSCNCFRLIFAFSPCKCGYSSAPAWRCTFPRLLLFRWSSVVKASAQSSLRPLYGGTGSVRALCTCSLLISLWNSGGKLVAKCTEDWLSLVLLSERLSPMATLLVSPLIACPCVWGVQEAKAPSVVYMPLGESSHVYHVYPCLQNLPALICTSWP